MSLEALKRDVIEGFGVVVSEEASLESDCYEPADIVEGERDGEWTIRYKPDLPPEQRDEAIAHEYGHLLLNYRGLALVRVNKRSALDLLQQDESELVAEELEPEDLLDFQMLMRLALNVRNAISHLHLMGVLKDEYDIASRVHVEQVSRWLKEDPRAWVDYQDWKAWIHGVGVNLYEIQQTEPPLQDQVNKVLAQNAAIRDGYRAAETHLADMLPGMARGQQKARMAGFLSALGYPTDLFQLSFLQ